MATTTFTLTNGTQISVESTGSVWQGHSLVLASSVEVGDTIGSGCGFAVSAVTDKTTA
jgi:hypothetical protein